MEDEVLSHAANSPRPLPNFTRKREGFTRADVVEAFQRSFEMIGGIQRLAMWGNANPTEFYKLYAKLIPPAQGQLPSGPVVIVHAIAPTPLDIHSVQPVVIDMITRQPLQFTEAVHLVEPEEE